MAKFTFSGHDTFHCRHFWLKKGYDFVKAGKKFSSDNAVVDLGVGKNMVNSIRFWLKSFYIVKGKHQETTKIADYIFGENGVDTYLEDIGTLWLLHYHLVTKAKASIYSFVFNDFRRVRVEFTKEHLQKFIVKRCSVDNYQYNENTIKRDINVFFSNYLPSSKSNAIEDNFSGLLNEVHIIEKLGKIGRESSGQWYRLEMTERPDLPALIVLYLIVNNKKYGNSISFKELFESNGVGSVFCLSKDALMEKIESFQKVYPDIIYKGDGGIQTLQFKNKPSPIEVLNKYYGC